MIKKEDTIFKVPLLTKQCNCSLRRQITSLHSFNWNITDKINKNYLFQFLFSGSSHFLSHNYLIFLPSSIAGIFSTFTILFGCLFGWTVAKLGVDAKHIAALPLIVPVRYDLQIQLPTSSVKDPLVPTFFGSVRIDFQLTRTLFDNRYYAEPQNSRTTNFLSSYNVELTLSSSKLDTFENVTLRAAGSHHLIQITDVRFSNNEAIFRVAETTLPAGRYTLHIERYQGLITYQKGIYYRDVGGYPVLGVDLFPNYTNTIFPCFGGPLTKTTVKLSVVHPQDTIALSNMHERKKSYNLNENWRVTKFVQAPNLAAYMFSLTILPTGIYEKTIVNDRGSLLPLHIWTNKIVHHVSLAQEIAEIAVKVYGEIYELLKENLPLAQLNILVMNEFNGTHSFGIITISFDEWNTSDEAHRIALLARFFARQWFGGVTTIGKYSEFCFQEDIVDYLASKIVTNLLKHSKKSMEQYFLAHYLRLHIAETFLAPGESVIIKPSGTNSTPMSVVVSQHTLDIHCGLKGAQMLHSLESIDDKGKEDSFMKKLRYIIKRQRYKTFTVSNLLELLRPQIVDSIDLAQVYDFWFKSGGIPNLLVEKHDERLQLTQLNHRRKAQVNAGEWSAMPLWPLRISIRNVSLPITFMTNQGLELAPLDSKLLALTNMDFKHLYRVNYDALSWERIIRHFDGAYKIISARNRAQLLNDFCYFNAVGQIDTKAADALRKAFLQLMRDQYEHFELCELYAFWCAGGYGRKINMDKTATQSYYELTRENLWPALRNNKNYECGGPGLASDAANALCKAIFGVNCL